MIFFNIFQEFTFKKEKNVNDISIILITFKALERNNQSMATKFGIKNAPKNRSSERDLKAAFFEIEPGCGLTGRQLNSLLKKTQNSREYELITIEGEEVTAMGLIDMSWFEDAFKFDPNKIENFVIKVIDGIYEESDDDIYCLKGGQIFIGCPDTY